MAVLMKINNTLQSVGALRKVSNALNRTNIELYKEEGISDLTGTKWLLNETIEYDSTFPTTGSPYNITYDAYCESGATIPLSGLYMQHVVNSRPPVDFYSIRYTESLGSINFSNFFLMYVLYTGNGTTSMTNSANEPSYNVELFNRIIEITGGTDVTNQDLIDWLQENATQIT